VTILDRDELIPIELGINELEEELTEEMMDEIAKELLAKLATDEGDLLLAGARFEPPPPPPPPQAISNVQEHKNSARRLHCHPSKTASDPIFRRIWPIP
jgi:hypothetical protein